MIMRKREVKLYPVATPAPVAPLHPISAVDSGNSAMTNPIRALYLSGVLSRNSNAAHLQCRWVAECLSQVIFLLGLWRQVKLLELLWSECHRLREPVAVDFHVAVDAVGFLFVRHSRSLAWGFVRSQRKEV